MKYLFYALIALALVAAFTKPTEEKVEALLKDRTLAAVQETDVDLTDMGLNGALVTMCKLQPNACWDVLKGLTKITYEDRYVYAKASLEGPGDPQVCYGGFRSLICF